MLLFFVGIFAFCLFPGNMDYDSATFLNTERRSSGLFYVDVRDDGSYGLYLNIVGDKPTFSMRTMVANANCDLEKTEMCPIGDEEVTFTTTWTGIKFDPNNMTIDTQDFTFAETDVMVKSSSDDFYANARLAYYKTLHVPFGVASGEGTLSYADLTG